MNTFIETLLREPRAPDPPPRFWFDWLLVIGFGLGALTELQLRDDVALPWVSLVWAWLAVTGVHIRRWQPLLAIVIGFGAGIPLNLATWWVGIEWDGLFSTACAILLPYTLLRWGSGREVVIGVLVILSGWAADVFVDFEGLDEAIAGVVFLMFPVIIGLTVRLQDRARRRELDRARLLEREQLARELHDSVAHHVSAIAIQAQAGRAVAANRPEVAMQVLATIETAASRTLEDMRGIVGALRGEGDIPLAPQPGIRDIPMLAGNRRTKPSISVELNGELDDLPPRVDASLYRLAQEAVTNALRHARHASWIEVRVEGSVDCVRLTIRDDGRGTEGSEHAASGFGLVGMAERVKLLGGTFQAGPAADGTAGNASPGGERPAGWVVNVEIPLVKDRS